jgi:hypothetical protein
MEQLEGICHRNMSKDVHIRLNKITTKPAFMYEFEIWTLRSRNKKRIGGGGDSR